MAGMKTHLVVSSPRHQERVTACGMRDPSNWSRSPAQVTCGSCRRSLAMADAEIKQRRSKRG